VLAFIGKGEDTNICLHVHNENFIRTKETGNTDSLWGHESSSQGERYQEKRKGLLIA
jgi:hypothetical protein